MYTYGQRQDIKENYKTFSPEKKSPYSYSPRGGFNMTPIEENVWNELRTYGLPFYPEFPVLNYFIDFADPVKKIGLEIDGKQWHQDFEKDAERQRELEKEGWKIYRVKGSDTFFDICFERDKFIFDYDYRERHQNFIHTEFYTFMCDLVLRYRGIDLHESNLLTMRAFNKRCCSWGRTDESDCIILGNKFLEIMQFTGIIDKNGKEVFEGDVVIGNTSYERDSDEYVWTIENPAYVNWIDSQAGFYPFTLGSRWRCDVYNIEVIGNIYENHELLNK